MLTDNQLQETYDFYQKLKNAVPFDFVDWIKAHRHNRNDFPAVRATDLDGIVPLATGGLGVALADPNADKLLFWDDSEGKFVFLTPGTGLSITGTTLNGSNDPSLVTVTAGETLVAGDVVKLYKAVGNYSSDGYQMVNGTVYAVRAAANDTTYGDEVLGVATASASYLGSATIAVVGYISGLTGLTAGSKYYLSDYNTTSAVTISQTTTNSNYQLYDPTGTVVLQQLFTPTQSRIDSITIKASKNGGFSGTLRFNLYRSNTNLASDNVVLAAGSTPAETTIDFADIRCYKGETLRFTLNHDSGVSSQTDAFYIAYQSTGSVYNGAFTGGSLPASGADIYFKVKEFSDFGKVGTSAGTRKFKLGQALSTTELALLIQEADSIL